jgi:hypothetical protein
MRWVFAVVLSGCAAPRSPVALPENLAAVVARPMTCRIYGRAFEARTGKPVYGATLEVGHAEAISDMQGGYELDVHDHILDVYYMESHVEKKLRDVPCDANVDLRFRLSDDYFHHGSCEPYPDVLGVDLVRR